MEEYITNSPEQTAELGKELAARLAPGDILALQGDLGCGKTAFVKGITAYFGDGEQVSSPTFTLVNEYEGSIPVYHFDVYRLEHPSPEECDWMDDYLFGEGICLIEWAEKVREILPENTLWVQFEKQPEQGDTVRKITLLSRKGTL